MGSTMLGGTKRKGERAGDIAVWARGSARSPMPSHASRKRAHGWTGLVLCTVSGFVLGAAFWNALGVWDFVGNVVLPDRRLPEQIVVTGCTSLAIDRTTRSTSEGPCLSAAAGSVETLTARLSAGPGSR